MSLPGKQIEGTTARLVMSHRRGHRVPNDIAVRDLYSTFMENVGAGYYGLVIFADGSATFAGDEPHTPTPPADVMHMMLALGRELNRELHANGHWVLAWHPHQRLEMIWRTGHGLTKFTVGDDQPWVRLRQRKIAEWLEIACKAMAGAAEIAAGSGMSELYRKLVPTGTNPGLHRLH